jgi:hypothetical protein
MSWEKVGANAHNFARFLFALPIKALPLPHAGASFPHSSIVSECVVSIW